MKPGTQTDLKKGDYVIATKWSDGDPCDQFCVGFYDGVYFDRHRVVDHNGKQFRHSGFRRCEKISQKVGDAIVRNIKKIGDIPGKSVWYWRYHPEQLNRL